MVQAEGKACKGSEMGIFLASYYRINREHVGLHYRVHVLSGFHVQAVLSRSPTLPSPLVISQVFYYPDFEAEFESGCYCNPGGN